MAVNENGARAEPMLLGDTVPTSLLAGFPALRKKFPRGHRIR